MADIQYLNYGDLQIEQLAFLNKAANEVQAYVLSQPWSKKRKEKFMSAYSDIMNKGVLGASNSTGQWMIDVLGNDINLESMSNKDKEMYLEAAYFIQQQMSEIPIKGAEIEKKKDLPLFDNEYFTNDFIKHISNKDFGGQDLIIGGKDDMWNYRDERDSNGKRGRTNRAKLLADYLDSYSKTLEEGKYNFEGSPFTDLNDFKTRLANASAALRTPQIEDDTDALNKIGLKASQWFNDGTGDVFTAEDGNQYTYADYYGKVLPQLEKLKLELKALEEKLKKQAAYNNTIFIGPKTSIKMFGRNPVELKEKYKNQNNLLAALQDYSQRGIKELNADEISELHGAYKNFATTPIDSELLERIKNSSSGLYRNATPNRFKKINGIDNFIWDSITNQVIQLQNKEQYEYEKNVPTDIFANIKTKEEKELLEKLAAKDRKMFSTIFDLDNPRYKDEDGSVNWWNVAKDSGVDVFRITALIADIGAAIASFVPGYGTAISAALSVSGLLQELIADLADDSVSGWDVAKNAGMNALFTLLGLIPGGKLLKLGPKLAKMGKFAMPITGMLLSSTAGASLLSDPEVKKSWNKVLDGNISELSTGDARNILLVLGTAVGVLQGGRGIRNAYKFNKVTPSVAQQRSIKTSKGIVTEKEPGQFKTLDEIGRNQGLEKANQYLNETIIGNKDAGHELTFNYSTNKINNSRLNPFRRWTSPTAKVETTYNPGALTTQQKSLLLTMQTLNKNIKAGTEGIGKYMPKFVRENIPTDYDLWIGNQNLLNPLKLEASLPNITPRINTGNRINAVSVSKQLFPNTKKSTSIIKPNNPEFAGKKLNIKEGFNRNEFDLGDGVKHSYELDLKNLILKIDGKNFKVKSHGEAKEKLAEFIKTTLKINSKKDLESKTFTPLFIDAIKKLKKLGLLYKLGGSIDKQRIQIYKQYINK